MDTSKIIKAVVGHGRYTTTEPIMKEDHGIYLKIEGLELPETYEIDFSNSRKEGTSVTMIGNADGVLIPTQFIKTGKDVFAFLYHVGEDYGKTVYTFCIPNHVRPDRTDETPEPEQQSVIDQAISALNTAVAQTAQDVLDADASATSAAQSAESASESADLSGLSARSAGEYASQASASATSAEAAQTAAETAQSAAETAAATATTKAAQASSAESAAASAAQTATVKAIEAAQIVEGVEGYAEAAEQSASSAQASAQTASTKASEASTSASTASAKATEATTAATSANTAKVDAVAAKTAAETAQGKAETAQEAAEDAAESVSASAAQIATNTADITELKENLTDKAPVIIESASGSIASFSDGADGMPMKSLVVDIDPVQSGSGDPSPDNVRPISGWTGVTAQRTGKNLCSVSTVENLPWVADNASLLAIVNSLKDGTYTVSFKSTLTSLNSGSESEMWITGFIWTNSVGNFNLQVTTNAPHPVGTTVSGSKTLTIDSTNRGKFTHAYCYGAGNNSVGAIGTGTLSEIQIELGSTATAYEPYQGNTYTIDWQSEAGTVYGGHIDVVSGELVVDRAMVDLGTLSWDSWNPNQGWVAALAGIKPMTNNNELVDAIASDLAVITKTQSESIVRGGGSADAIAATWQGTYIYGSNPNRKPTGQFCYKLATPITYHLTPTEVQSILGQNHVWADCGECNVEYRADTKLYIQRLTQPDTADMIADANITSGQYFMVGNSLYKATANIANGGQIIVGTNCTRKSLSEALNEINS